MLTIPCDLPAGEPGRPVVEPEEIHNEFLRLLDEKLRRRNERLIAKLLAWGELLDLAGWSVALNHGDGKFWLSPQAAQDLLRLGDLPETWAGVLVASGGQSGKTLHRKSDGVLLWSPWPATTEVRVPAADLTRREAEVMSWVRKGKTGPEIAIIFGCATRTVEKHLANLYRKLGVNSSGEVIMKAYATVP